MVHPFTPRLRWGIYFAGLALPQCRKMTSRFVAAGRRSGARVKPLGGIK
ncbi:hypothetical protein [Geobacillus jurassicus]|uniref:Uncharacterized protein n=1 Tax=Geobacillus jurassicus TaxID=235932 RepID=A0ABV6GNX0_9BACL|nr:hypothetical protein [Geobacillus jurassicus]